MEVVTDAIREVTPHGIITVDGREREVDALIYGTGFQATDFFLLYGFLLYGPNTNLGHNSIVFMLESQVRYVLACLRVLRERNLRFLDVRPEAQRDFNTRLQRGLERTVWAAGCTSWYKTAEGKNTNNWPGFTFHYRRQTRGPRLAHYEAV